MRFARPSGASCARLLLVLSCLVIAGCDKASLTPNQAVEKGLKDAGISKDTVYPLGGTVTIDSQPPALQQGQRLVVMLNDPQKPNESSASKLMAEATSNGEFSFGTYQKADGVKPGKYTLTFAVLRRKGKRGLAGPDALKNLFNDPDKNANISEFIIDHQAPGKSNYAFNLEFAGKDAAQPGPHSLTDLTESFK
jgi:hypothetical protein